MGAEVGQPGEEGHVSGELVPRVSQLLGRVELEEASTVVPVEAPQGVGPRRLRLGGDDRLDARLDPGRRLTQAPKYGACKIAGGLADLAVRHWTGVVRRHVRAPWRRSARRPGGDVTG